MGFKIISFILYALLFDPAIETQQYMAIYLIGFSYFYIKSLEALLEKHEKEKKTEESIYGY